MSKKAASFSERNVQDLVKDETSKRMTVNLPSETARMLDILSKLQSISLNEAIRRAISTESFIQNEIRNNKSKIFLETPDGDRRELIFR